MKTGTKSLLFGVHQFAWHPLTVWLAWIYLYKKLPTFKETICIIIHDWGYWGCDKMDDEHGELHPLLGAKIALKLLDGRNDRVCEACMKAESFDCFSDSRFNSRYAQLIALHSRHLSHRLNREPSELAWPDKLSVLFDPGWFYLIRARLSGELSEFKANGERHLGRKLTDKEWMNWLKSHLRKVAYEKLPAIRSSSKMTKV